MHPIGVACNGGSPVCNGSEYLYTCCGRSLWRMGIIGKTKALGYSWSSSSTPDWNTGMWLEINTFCEDGLDLRRFDYGVAIGLSVEYRHYVIGVEGRLGLCKLQRTSRKNITGFANSGI